MRGQATDWENIFAKDTFDEELICIKDTWTKSGGMVEVGEGSGFSWGGVEGRGEKAYNCN